MRIRVAKTRDAAAIESLYRSTFPAAERELVAPVAIDLLQCDLAKEVLSLVAEVDGDVAGHVAFSRVSDDETGGAIGAIVAPLAVRPEMQRRGIGTALVNKGIEQWSACGVDLYFVYGDPAFYSRFGFEARLAQCYRSVHPMTQPEGWQALTLRGEVIGDRAITIRCVPALERANLW